MNEGALHVKQHIIELQKWRSVTALIACSVTLLFSSGAIVGSILYFYGEGCGPFYAFRYFTALSNTVTFFASGIIFPFAVNGVRMKRFVYPKWLAMLRYAGTICTTLTFVFAMAFILPTNRELAIGGNNFFLHIICPIAVLISYEMVESGFKYKKREILICLIPLVIYSFVYLTMVVFVGEANGGWPYMLNTFVPAYVSLPAVWLLAFLTAYAINKSSSLFINKREKEMLTSFEEDLDPIAVRIEVFSLGRHYGKNDDKNDMSVPYDVLELLSDKLGMDIQDLVKVYTAGLLAGIRDR